MDKYYVLNQIGHIDNFGYLSYLGGLSHSSRVHTSGNKIQTEYIHGETTNNFTEEETTYFT